LGTPSIDTFSTTPIESSTLMTRSLPARTATSTSSITPISSEILIFGIPLRLIDSFKIRSSSIATNKCSNNLSTDSSIFIVSSTFTSRSIAVSTASSKVRVSSMLAFGTSLTEIFLLIQYRQTH